MTRRQEIIEILSETGHTVKELADRYETTVKDIETDLESIRKTLKRMGKKLIIKPSVCISCDFRFTKRDKIRSPSKCPKCRSENIAPQVFSVK